MKPCLLRQSQNSVLCPSRTLSEDLKTVGYPDLWIHCAHVSRLYRASSIMPCHAMQCAPLFMRSTMTPWKCVRTDLGYKKPPVLQRYVQAPWLLETPKYPRASPSSVRLFSEWTKINCINFPNDMLWRPPGSHAVRHYTNHRPEA